VIEKFGKNGFASGSKLNKLSTLAFKQICNYRKLFQFLNDSNILLSIKGNCLEYCFIYVVWWLFETKAIWALRKKPKFANFRGLKLEFQKV